MAIQDMLNNITDRINAITTVNTVFGEARMLNNRAIIPIAAVCGGFGAGGGEGKSPSGEQKPKGEGSGGGVGGGYMIRPLAVLEVSDEATRLIPIVDVTRITLGAFGLVGGALWMILKLRSKARRERHHDR